VAASSKWRASIDRELHLPTSWNRDSGRCTAAGIPAGIPGAWPVPLRIW